MRYMNEYDIDNALTRYCWSHNDTPNRFRLAETVANLAAWADLNSDGWHSWPKPVRAAQKAIAHIYPSTYAECEAHEFDITAAEVTAALRPIKAFLTRQGVSHEGIVR